MEHRSIEFSIPIAVFVHVSKGSAGKRAVNYLLGVFMVALGLALWPLGVPFFGGLNVGYGLAVLIALLGLRASLKQLYENLSRSPAGQPMFGPMVLTLLDDGIASNYRSGRSSFCPWRSMTSIESALDGWILRVSQSEFYWVPDNVFSADAMTVFNSKVASVPRYPLKPLDSIA